MTDTPENVSQLKTAQDLFVAIPKNWMDAYLRIANGIGGSIQIRRISFHQNDDGKRIILVHDTVL